MKKFIIIAVVVIVLGIVVYVWYKNKKFLNIVPDEKKLVPVDAKVANKSEQAPAASSAAN